MPEDHLARPVTRKDEERGKVVFFHEIAVMQNE
jgi:hypothetical protein